MLLYSLHTAQSQRPPWGEQVLMSAVTLHSVGRGAQRQKFDSFSFTVSDELTHPILAATANLFLNVRRQKYRQQRPATPPA